jgi:serine/threonine-protein kinase
VDPPAVTTAPAPTTAAATPPGGPTGERTLSSSGGTVRAQCPSAGTAELLSWSAAKSWKVEQVSAGPGSAPTAEFRHGNQHLVMTVTCSSGVPSTSNDES